MFVVDLADYGYSNFDMKQFSKIAPILSNNYAESLNTMYLIRAGFIFSAMYAGIKPFIHEVTKQKFIFTGNSYLDQMLQRIDKANIPKEYGGDGPALDDIQW